MLSGLFATLFACICMCVCVCEYASRVKRENKKTHTRIAATPCQVSISSHLADPTEFDVGSYLSSSVFVFEVSFYCE